MRSLFTAILLITSFVIKAQEQASTNYQNRHEFRLDALEILAIPNLEINYEYVINRYSGVGLAASVSLDDDFSDYQKYAIEPYFRQYFFNRRDYGARGLFVEGVVRFAAGENDDIFDFFGNELEEDWFEIGVGFVVGQKWVSENGFVFEISLGGGRYLLDENENDFFARGGILIGYRLF